MARPREFDETTVLEAAMNCFWAQGFEQTSVRDLAQRMGITGASLYNAFGDKRSLYRRAFVHYLAQTVRDRVARLEKLPPALAIRTFSTRSSSGRSTTSRAAAACWSMRR
jgi:TetR/AcrR family transcriptional repressor of nem operon